MNKNKTIAIIIARMTSSRLPEKHMRLINGKPMIYHIIARLKKVDLIDKIVMATASREENQELADYVAKFNVQSFFYEDEDDVTGRIAMATTHFCSTHIVTVSGDCPLIHPPFIRRGIATLKQKKADYLYCDHSTYECLHEGLGFYTAATWKQLDKLSTTWYHKEHPGSVLSEHRDEFRGVEIVPETAFRRHDFRMSVDTMADLDFMNYLYSELQKESIVDLYDVVNLLDDYPYIKLLNAHVHQKELTEKSDIVAIVTHADREVGLGHLSRCMALAHELKESQSLQVIFFINKSESAKSLLQYNGFVYTVWDGSERSDDIADILKRYEVSGIILDLKRESHKWLNHWLGILRSFNLPTIAIDQLPKEKKKALLSIIPTVYSPELAKQPQKEEDIVFWGKDYLLLNRKISFWRENESVQKEGILVTLGGSGGCSDFLLQALTSTDKNYKKKFISGPFSDLRSLKSRIEQFGLTNYEIICNPLDPYKIYSESHIAISIFGVTTYELIALGIPTIVIQTLNKEDDNIVAFMAQNEVCIDALAISEDSHALRKKIKELMSNSALRREMSAKSTLWIDGSGVERVASFIKAAVTSNNSLNASKFPLLRPHDSWGFS